MGRVRPWPRVILTFAAPGTVAAVEQPDERPIERITHARAAVLLACTTSGAVKLPRTSHSPSASAQPEDTQRCDRRWLGDRARTIPPLASFLPFRPALPYRSANIDFMKPHAIGPFALLVAAVLMTGCGSKGADVSSANDQKAAACKQWEALRDVEYKLRIDVSKEGPSGSELESLMSDLAASEESTKKAFAAAAADDSVWNDVQVGVYDYLESGFIPSMRDASLRTPVKAACDRLG